MGMSCARVCLLADRLIDFIVAIDSMRWIACKRLIGRAALQFSNGRRTGFFESLCCSPPSLSCSFDHGLGTVNGGYEDSHGAHVGHLRG